MAREEMARLPLSAYAKAWFEGMVVNLASPALLIDPRVRALPKPSFYNTPGASLWEKTGAYLFDDPGGLSGPPHRRAARHAAHPAARSRRVRHAGAHLAVGGGVLRRRAGLFPPAQWAGGDAQISSADGADPDRARRDPARADGGAFPSPSTRLAWPRDVGCSSHVPR